MNGTEGRESGTEGAEEGSEGHSRGAGASEWRHSRAREARSQSAAAAAESRQRQPPVHQAAGQEQPGTDGRQQLLAVCSQQPHLEQHTGRWQYQKQQHHQDSSTSKSASSSTHRARSCHLISAHRCPSQMPVVECAHRSRGQCHPHSPTGKCLHYKLTGRQGRQPGSNASICARVHTAQAASVCRSQP